VLRLRTLAFATFLVWRLRTGACGVGASGFGRYRMPPVEIGILKALKFSGGKLWPYSTEFRS